MNVMYLSIALLLANHGYGSLSLDQVIGVSAKTRPLFAWLALGGAIGVAAGILSQRQFTQPSTIGETIRKKTTSPVR